jgi:integrase
MRIHTPDVQIYLNQKAERYAPSVLYHIRATLSRTYASAKEWGYVESNPAHGVRLPQKRTIRPKITFEPSQVEKIHEKLKEPHRTLALVAAVTGMRISELFGLKWSDVDFERRLLRVRRTYYRGSFGLPRIRPASESFQSVRAWCTRYNATRRKGDRARWIWFSRMMRGIRTKTGICCIEFFTRFLQLLACQRRDGEHFADPSQQR